MKTKGVTLIEIMVVIGIIAILAGAVLPVLLSKKDVTIYVAPIGYKIITVDGCQYVVNPSGSMFVHKANCTNHASMKAEQ